MEKELTGREEEPSELIYFKVYKSQIAVIDLIRLEGESRERGKRPVRVRRSTFRD